MPRMFSGRLVSNCQSSAVQSPIKFHKSVRQPVGTSSSKTSAILAQNTRGQRPLSIALAFHAMGFFQFPVLVRCRGAPAPQIRLLGT